jgi:hypothetical protein
LTADNRTFQSNGGTFRTSDRFIIEPNGDVRSVTSRLGSTFGVLPGIGDVRHSGAVNQVDSTMSAYGNARTLSPFPPFNINYMFNLKVAGSALSVSGTHDGFPSYEIWQYEVGKNAKLLYSHSETNVFDLVGCCDQVVP